MRPRAWLVSALAIGVLGCGGSQSSPAAPSAPPTVLVTPAAEATTLAGKLMMGYQGWFGCPGDGSAANKWQHWFKTSSLASTDNVNVDMWPEVSEYDPDELCPSALPRPDGAPAPLYSAYRSKTVLRHFRWMKDYGIDGVFVQRFTANLVGDSLNFAFRNQVLQNARAGAEASRRVYAVMLDISSHNEATLVTDLQNDWKYLVDTLKVTESPNYLREKGRPVLAIWGLGFLDRPGTAAQAQALIDYFKTGAPERYRVTLMGGVPARWRTLGEDSRTDPQWSSVYRSFDILSPWAVGRYRDDPGADTFLRNAIQPDLAETKALGIIYSPVVFPGFSWFNKKGAALNQTPRRGGSFYWRQVYNAVGAGATNLYGAMFDEVDEGTAMYKVAPTAAEAPANASLVTMNADGEALPSDWYLRVARESGRMLRNEIPLSPQMPLLR